jgi:signal transduction histidine kinase
VTSITSITRAHPAEPGVRQWRHWWPDPAPLLDAGLAAALLIVTLGLLAHGGIKAAASGGRPGTDHLDAVAVGLAALTTLPLVAWRRAPFAVFAVTAAASVALVGRGNDLDLALGAAVALFLLAVTGGPDRPLTRTGPTVAMVVGLFLAYLTAAALDQRAFPGPEMLHTSLAWAAAWFAGERTRLRHAHIAQLHDRAVRAERDADRERQLATAEERARIARDLHDSAGHAISVIAVRAGAARLRHAQDPDRSLQALEAIEELARQTAADIDHIVGTLRTTAGGRPGSGCGSEPYGTVEAPFGLASLDTLVARHAAAGLEVAVEASGTARPLSPPADQAAYRILQEALTNAARHGAGAARVGLAYGERDLELTVTNPVAPADPGGDGHGEGPSERGGHGLVGMRERAALLGGELHAGRVDGSFRVTVRLPCRPVGRRGHR